MDDNNFDIRNKLAYIIQERALKQAELARRADMSPIQLCGVLKGRRKLDANEFIKICYAMRMTCDEVIHYDTGGNK